MIRTLARSLIKQHNLKDSFYIYELEKLQDNVRKWNTLLPLVKPYYAIKCNPDDRILSSLASANIGFDCASRCEITHALRLTHPSNLIFAHPCKRMDEIMFAEEHGIQLTTFDTFTEINKLADSPLDCLLRIKVDNPTAKVQLGLKYGAEVQSECEEILRHARDKNVNVVGVSFHVGSASRDPSVFETAIKNSRHVMDMMQNVGFTPSVLNIGGGFTSSTFEASSNVIKKSLDRYMMDVGDLKIMAEPGRFFVENIATFFTPIIGTRYRRDIKEYWITDGLYGSFNCILYDQQQPEVQVLRDVDPNEERYKTIVWGATCDSADRLNQSADLIRLPNLNPGDWMMFPNFGAYTIAGATNFNGINMMKPRVFYI